MSVTTFNQAGNALVPHGFAEAVRFAEMMAKSKMVPKHFQGKPEECLVIIEQAMRWEMSPYAVIQCASMIHDRPMYEGKLVAAVVNARGPAYGLQGRLHFDYSGAGDNRTVTVWGLLDGRKETVDVIVRDAKTSNEQWKKQPDQQLAYHGSRVWARRHMPELMLGVYSPEEFDRNARPVEEPFVGTTIEGNGAAVEKEPDLTPNDYEPSWLEQLDEKLASEPNGTKWLRLFDAELARVQTREDAEGVAGLPSVAKAYEAAPPMIKERINEIMRKAVARFDLREAVQNDPDFLPAETENV